jgi:hypothetical protein
MGRSLLPYKYFVVGWWKLWATRFKSCPSDGDNDPFYYPHQRQYPPEPPMV